MSKAELIAKMSAHGVAITGAGFGGTIEISAMDVAGALGMGRLQRPAYLFGILKYAGDHSALGQLDRIVRGHVFAVSKNDGWGLTDAQIIGLSALAVYENINNPVCDRCNGCGEVAARPCDKCSGCGRLPLSNRRRAQIAGIPEASWRRQWKARAARCYGIVSQWDAEVVEHLSRQFRFEATA